VGEAHALEPGESPGLEPIKALPANHAWQRDIFPGAQLRNEMKKLKYKADISITPVGFFVIRQGKQGLSSPENLTLVRLFQQG